MKIGIIGAGLAGLTLGNQLNHDFEILEKNSISGGLCRSLIENGWTFDLGGSHIIFSSDQKLLDYMLSLMGSNIVKTRRNTKIFLKNCFVKYPLENGLLDLPKDDNFECLYYYIEARLKEARGELKDPKNFKEWLYNMFGKGMADRYLIPYNEKIWRCRAEELGVEWVAGRVPLPPVEDVIKSSLGITTEGYTHQLFFYYPKLGGIQSLVESLEKKITNKVNKHINIKKIKKEGKEWILICEDRTRKYSKLVSTIPLMEIIKLLDDNVPITIRNAIKNLKYTSLVEIMIGLDAPHKYPITWLYVPAYSDGRFNRVSFPSHFSSNVAPPNCSSILVEATCKENDDIWQKNDDEIIKETIRDLKRMNIIGQQRVIFTKVARSKYAYVVYDLNYTKNVTMIYDYFSKLGIELCGRFSEFKYINMDATMRSAIQMAEKLNKLRD